MSGKGINLARHLVVREMLTLDQNYREELNIKIHGEKKGLTVWKVFSAGALVTPKSQMFENELFSPQILWAFIIFISWV